MVAIVLQVPDFAHLANPVATRVKVPHLIAAPLAERFDGTSVRFDGDRLPTAFLGEGDAISRTLTCLYGGTEHEQLAQLVRLIKLARAHPEPRLLFRTHIGQVPDFDPIMAVVVFGYEISPERGQLQRLTLTVDAVSWDGEDD